SLQAVDVVLATTDAQRARLPWTALHPQHPQCAKAAAHGIPQCSANGMEPALSASIAIRLRPMRDEGCSLNRPIRLGGKDPIDEPIDLWPWRLRSCRTRGTASFTGQTESATRSTGPPGRADQ